MQTAAKKSSADKQTFRKHTAPSRTSANPSTTAISPVNAPCVQAKVHCPCGGGCPGCQNSGGNIQTSLHIGSPGDKYEQEADRVAEQVLRMPESTLQRQEIPGEEEEHIQTKPTAPAITPPVQRQVSEDEEEELIQAKETGITGRNVPSQTSIPVHSLQGGGQSLSESERKFFEPRFGTNFSKVRLHTNLLATGMAQSIKARAFTFGHNIVFGAGEYSSNTQNGKRLLAHELTHVVQQKGRSGLIQRELSGDYTIPQLRSYLRERARTGRIEGSNSGDNMARDVVAGWVEDLTFSLTPRLKILLIHELQDGRVGNDDEQSILALLQHSYNDEMSSLFGPGGVSVATLDSVMHGDEQDELDAFYERRFQGGKEAVRRGTIRPRGRPEPLWPVSREGWRRAQFLDCMHQPSGILPGRIGMLAQMRTSSMTAQHFTRAELATLERLIRANRTARRFVCSHGLPGLLAISDTLDGTTINITEARTRVASDELLREIYRPFLRRQRRSRETVGDVSSWARQASRPTTIPSMASIVGLPTEHRTALDRVLHLLQANTTGVGRLSSAFQRVVSTAQVTPARIQQLRSSSMWRRGWFPYEQAENASTAAEAVVTSLLEANQYIDCSDLLGRARTIQTSLEGLPGQFRGELTADQRDAARDQIRALRSSARTLLGQVRTRSQTIPSAVSFQRVRYLLTYFLAMNDTSSDDSSTTAQRQEFIASLSDFNDDLRAVFGTRESAIHSPAEFLEILGSRLGRQMAVRNQMEQRLNQDPGAVPGMENVRAYFRTLHGQPTAVIEQAYERYAGAYFEHRGLNNQTDLQVDEFSDLFNRPIGIGGTRRLVCSGFARLGARLLMDAGATFVRYRIRFHYTPAQVATQSFSDGHAVARLRLGQTHLWVSNQYIFHSLTQAMNVAWSNPDAPSTDGTGATLEVATGALSFPTN